MILEDEWPPEINPEITSIVGKMYALRELYWPAYTWHVQTSYLKILEKKKHLGGNRAQEELIKSNFSNLFNKINASFYHLQKIKDNEELITLLGRQLAEKSKSHTPSNVLGIFGASYEPISYEYEAFLISLKSGLDIFAIIFSSMLPSKSDDIMKLFNEIKQTKKPKGLKAGLKKLFNSPTHQSVINEFKNDGSSRSRRNYAVHSGSLSTGTINLQFTANDPRLGLIKAKALKSSNVGDIKNIFEEKDLDEYCETLFYSTCDLLIDGLELILEEKLTRGSKKSVLEAKKTNSSS